MCRLLGLVSVDPMRPHSIFKAFAKACQSNNEFQGDGWGLAWSDGGNWTVFRELNPIWETDFILPEKVTGLLVHARSAFENYDVALPYNMPFNREGFHFIFNGELHGVRIPVKGISGAEKIFNLARKLHRGCWNDTLKRLSEILQKRSQRVKAANMILADGARLVGLTRFDCDPDYFSLWRHRQAGLDMVCSEKLATVSSWSSIPNGWTFQLGGSPW